jgi:hypothetical protein
MLSMNTLLQALYYFEEPVRQTIKIKHNSVISSILIGAGLYHSISIEKKPYTIPIVFVFPSVYAGYNTFKFIHTNYNIEKKLE